MYAIYTTLFLDNRLRMKVAHRKLLSSLVCICQYPVFCPHVQNQHVDNNKYRTLPGKLSRLKTEQNGEREKYSSPLQLSPDESEDSQFNLSE